MISAIFSYWRAMCSLSLCSLVATVLETYEEESPHPHWAHSQHRKTNAIGRILWNWINWIQSSVSFPCAKSYAHYFYGSFPLRSICLKLSCILWRGPKKNLFRGLFPPCWCFLLPSASLKLCSKLAPNYELSCFQMLKLPHLI